VFALVVTASVLIIQTGCCGKLKRSYPFRVFLMLPMAHDHLKSTIVCVQISDPWETFYLPGVVVIFKSIE